MGQTTKWSSVAASENGVYIWYTKNWLVVWNFFYFPYIGNNHPCLRTHIFQRGRLNHQPEMAISHEIWMISDGISGDFILQKISGMGIGWYVGIRTYYDNSATCDCKSRKLDSFQSITCLYIYTHMYIVNPITKVFSWLHLIPSKC